MQPPRPLTILTGASRGLGAAIAAELVQRGGALLTMSRHPDQTLNVKATATGAALEQWAIDLADGVSASARLEAWLAGQQQSFSSATLINNAALAGKAAPIGESDAAALAAVLRVGLEAPMLLTRAFLRATRDWRIPRRGSEHFVRRRQKAVERHRSVLRCQGGPRSLSRAWLHLTKHTHRTVR